MPLEYCLFVFQCSSASRKFLNAHNEQFVLRDVRKFQCSSASRKFLNSVARFGRTSDTRFQCSSASRKFLNASIQRFTPLSYRVSVLFSEPKIPQFCFFIAVFVSIARFSALQRAENSSIPRMAQRTDVSDLFQCSSASRKFLNRRSFE